MDGKGRWMDNVFIERLWRSVKHEGVYLWAPESVHELERLLTRWFEDYNRLNRVGRQGWFAATTTPCPHLPLIEPDGRVSRIRLSEAVHRFAS